MFPEFKSLHVTSFICVVQNCLAHSAVSMFSLGHSLGTDIRNTLSCEDKISHIL
jgi:hypothetical protein